MTVVLYIHIKLAIILEYRSGFLKMKQRKSPKNHPKKVALGDGHVHSGTFVQSTNKQPSGHTKMSTNYTIHSAAIEQARKQKKPNPRSNSKENPLTGSRKLPNSKSTKKLKINLEVDRAVSPQAQISYRQYCLIDENFVPVVNLDEKKMLQEMLSQTATTSCDFNFNLKSTEGKQTTKHQLRRRAISKSSEQVEQMLPKVERVDVSTSIKQVEPLYTSIEVSAVPELAEIGLQYSARFEEKQPQPPQVPPKQSKKVEVPAVVENQSLSDLLFKLEFSHLGDEKSFSSLTSNQKEHFSQLLQTLVSKLKVKPQMKPITFPEEKQPVYSQPAQKQQERFLIPNYQHLQQLICLRQYHQMNWIEASTQETQQEVHTSLYSAVSFLCHLFCFVEMHYSEEFLYMIQKYYGHTCREKYRRITRGIPLIPDRKFRVIEDGIFLEFINESNAYSSPSEIAHLKAIFDAFNEHLEQYRPFFQSNGEQFPWVMRMFVSMSEYSINEQSLQIIFMQAKEKMVQWCSMLCGLLVQHKQKAMLPGNPLQQKRQQRQDKLILSWLKEQNFEKDGIELYCTQFLHETAESIYQQVLQECVEDILTF